MIQEVYFLWGGQFILCLFSHFGMQDLKNSNFFAWSTPIFNIHIFRFKMDAGLKVCFDFNAESNFFCSRSSFFSPLGEHSKPTKPMKLLPFLSILEGFQNHLLSKAILCEYKQTWHLLFKIKGNSFLNKQRVYNMKESFEMESADLLSLTDNPLY